MAVTTPPTITAAPSPAPVRSDRTTFSTRVDAFVTWLIGAVSQLSAVASNVYTNATDAAQSASTATTKATATSNDAVQTAADRVQTGLDRVAAASSAANAASLFDQFDDKWLGAKTSDPMLDNDGNALVAGALYVNTATEYVRFYTGSAWVQGIGAVAGVSSINSLTGAVTLKSINGVALTGAGDIFVATRARNFFNAN